MASLGQLFVELGVFADTEELKEFEKNLDSVNTKIKNANKNTDKNANATRNMTKEAQNFVKGVAGVITALVGASYALNRFTNDLVRSNQAMLNLTRTSDISLSTFQKWDGIGKMLGVQNAAQQLEGLNQRLFELRLTGQGARGFQLAGINPAGGAENVLEQLRNRISGLSDTSASYLLQQMGLDPQMLHLLRMSREEFDALGQTIKRYQLTAEQRKNIQQMNMQLEVARTKLQYLKDRAILALMPYWTRFLSSLADIAVMLAQAGKAIGSFIIKWQALILPLGLGLARIQGITKGIKAFLLPLRSTQAVILKLIRSIPIFGRGIAALGATINASFLPVIGTLTAVFLLLEDFAVYMNGGKSVIGDLINAAQGIGEEFKNAFSLFGQGRYDEGIQALLEAITHLGEGIEELLNKILDCILDIITLGGWGDIKKSKVVQQLPKEALNPINYMTPYGLTKLYKGYKEKFDNNSITNNKKDLQITQNIQIATDQPANDIYRSLLSANSRLTALQ